MLNALHILNEDCLVLVSVYLSNENQGSSIKFNQLADEIPFI